MFASALASSVSTFTPLSSSASIASSTPSSTPCSPPSAAPTLSSQQVRLRFERLAAKRQLESAPLWLQWRAAIERLQQLQVPQPTPSSSSTSSQPRSVAGGASSQTSTCTGSEMSTPPSLSPASSPASSVSSASSSSSPPSSSALTPEVLLSLSDGFELLDDSDPVFVEQALLQQQLTQQRRVEQLKAELVRSHEWQALVRVNEQLRTAAKKDTEGLRATLKGWSMAAASVTPTQSPPLSAADSPAPRSSRALPPPLSLSIPDELAHDSPHTTPPHPSRALTSTADHRDPTLPPPSSASIASTTSTSASVLLSPPAGLTPALRPVAVHSQPTWPASFMHSSAAALGPIGPSMALPAPSTPVLMRHPAHPAHCSPTPLMPAQSAMPLLASPFQAPRASAFSPASAFSSIKPRPLDHPSPPLPPSLLHTLPTLATAGILPARLAHPNPHATSSAPQHPHSSSSSSRHAAGDPSRLRSPPWCSGLIEDPHLIVPEHGLGLTSHDVHLQMCGTEKHQLQRLGSRQDGQSVLSSLLRALHFDVERNHEHPTPALVDQLRRELRRAVEGWSDARFAAALPRHLRGVVGRAELVAKQLSGSGGGAAALDPALLWVWRAATHKAPRIYLITVAPPTVKTKVKEEGGRMTDATSRGTTTATRSAPPLPSPSPPGHSLRLQILGEPEPLPSTPCLLIYQNLCTPLLLPHHEALAWKKGTRGPSRLKTVHAYHEPIVGALEAWYRARQHMKALGRKRKRVGGGVGVGVGMEVEGVGVGGGGGMDMGGDGGGKKVNGEGMNGMAMECGNGAREGKVVAMGDGAGGGGGGGGGSGLPVTALGGGGVCGVSAAAVSEGA